MEYFYTLKKRVSDIILADKQWEKYFPTAELGPGKAVVGKLPVSTMEIYVAWKQAEADHKETTNKLRYFMEGNGGGLFNGNRNQQLLTDHGLLCLLVKDLYNIFWSEVKLTFNMININDKLEVTKDWLLLVIE